MKISPQEIFSVSNLSPFERYKYSIKRIADSEKLYTLVNTNREFAVAEIDNKMMLSFWSAREFVERCKIEEWKDFLVKEISLDQLENEVLSHMKQFNYLFNIFPLGENSGFVVTPEEFLRDLNDALDEYK